jgi:hypothetical protein
MAQAKTMVPIDHLSPVYRVLGLTPAPAHKYRSLGVTPAEGVASYRSLAAGADDDDDAPPPLYRPPSYYRGTDLLFDIFGNMSAEQVFKCRTVCKVWRDRLDANPDSREWRGLFLSSLNDSIADATYRGPFYPEATSARILPPVARIPIILNIAGVSQQSSEQGDVLVAEPSWREAYTQLGLATADPVRMEALRAEVLSLKKELREAQEDARSLKVRLQKSEAEMGRMEARLSPDNWKELAVLTAPAAPTFSTATALALVAAAFPTAATAATAAAAATAAICAENSTGVVCTWDTVEKVLEWVRRVAQLLICDERRERHFRSKSGFRMMAKAAAREIVYRACTHPGRRQSAAGAYVQVARIFSENVYEWWSRSIAELADAVIEKVSTRAPELREMSMRSFDAYVKSMVTVVLEYLDRHYVVREGVTNLAAVAAPHQARVRLALGLAVPTAQ